MFKSEVHERSAKSFDISFLNDVCESEVFYENDIYAFDSTIVDRFKAKLCVNVIF